ncbi:MAG: NUDIX domain-containing protein [Myxococcota bacterium]
MIDALWRAALRVAYRVLWIYWHVFRPRTEGVCVLVWHEGRLLVLRHSYKSGVGIPAGAPRRGEAPIATALRELREEVGITLPAESLRLLGECHSRHEAKRDHLVAFETRLERAPAIEIDRREIVAAWWAAPGELDDAELWPPLHELLDLSRAGG